MINKNILSTCESFMSAIKKGRLDKQEHNISCSHLWLAIRMFLTAFTQASTEVRSPEPGPL